MNEAITQWWQRLLSLGRVVRGRQRGQSLVIITFAFIGILAFVGLAVDLGWVFVQRVRVAQAADAAALAGASELPVEDAAWARALVYLQENGYDHTADDVEVFINKPSHAPTENMRATIWVTTPETLDRITVRVREPVFMTFMQFIGFRYVPVEATAEAENISHLDIAIVYDRSGSMEYDTVCYGCWGPSDEQYPDGNIYPLLWSGSTIASADHCGTDDLYHESGDEYYIVVEAEEYSRLNLGGADYTRAITTPYHTYWAVQRNEENEWANEGAGEPVGAKGRDGRGAYLSHHPFPNYRDTTGLGVSCELGDLRAEGELCRSDMPDGAGGPFPAPRAEYDFYAPRADNYYFHIRGQGGGREGDGYIHWGVGGSKERKGGFPLGPRYDGAVESAWQWSRLGGEVWLEEGRHTLNLWAGGAGFSVDRIIVTTDRRNPLPASITALPANDGRTDWACDPCDPRFAGRPGGHESTAEEPYYRPHCDQDQRLHPIYDDEQPIRDALEAAKYFVQLLNPRLDQVGYVPYSDVAGIPGDSDYLRSQLECLRRRGAPRLESLECDPHESNPGGEPPCDPDCGCFARVITNTVLYELDHTRAGGKTNIAHGIQLGIDVLGIDVDDGHYGRPGTAQIIVLLTDGEANEIPPGDEGCGDPKGCVLKYAGQARDKNIKIFTFTLGQSADQELMAEVADLTGGWHRHAPTSDELKKRFQELFDNIFLRLIR
jgi:hypothetical protein